MAEVDLADLDAFTAVARQRSFRGAAMLQGVSASTLSEAVRRLETRLGVRLLNRTTRSVTLTEAGARLLERLVPALGEVSAALDADDPIPGTYQLEVTSPGVERKLKKWQDWERFQGQKAKIVLKEPAGDLKHFDGVIARAAQDQTVTVELAGGRQVTFPFAQVDRANLKFEW